MRVQIFPLELFLFLLLFEEEEILLVGKGVIEDQRNAK